MADLRSEVPTGHCWDGYLSLLFRKWALSSLDPCGATDTPVLDFWWCLLWISKPEWLALFIFGRGVCVTHSLSFTSGVIPADLLAPSMAAKPFSSTYLWAGIGGAWNQELSCSCGQCDTRQVDALLTELCRLGQIQKFLFLERNA